MSIDLSNGKWFSREEIPIYNNLNSLVIEFDDRKSNSGFNYIQYENITSFVRYSEKDRTDMKPNSWYCMDFDAEIEDDLNTILVLKTYSYEEQLTTKNLLAGDKIIFKTSENIKSYKIAIRVAGRGKVKINKITIYEVSENIYSKVLGVSKEDTNLVLSNGYPHDYDLYRNAFLHRRVKLYKKDNLDLDVFYVSNQEYLTIYEFDEITIYKGNYKILEEFIKIRRYKKALIHFVDKNMIDAIDNVNSNIKKIIWIHGYEAESWKRRKHNFTKEEIERTKDKLEKGDKEKFDFLRQIYANDLYTFIFVSNYHKKSCEEDSKCAVLNYHIIPNVIDENLFKYRFKELSKRKKIVLIRPFKNNNCANDLAVKAILELSNRSFFNDIEISIYGQGGLFDETVEPLRMFDNIKLNKKFLRQEEIATIHSENGVLLCPTRKDSQGVTIGEAMSSGLVPITMDIDAISEFVVKDTGILCKSEDYIAIANAIEYIYMNPILFARMSRKASKFIKNKCGINMTINRELKIIKK